MTRRYHVVLIDDSDDDNYIHRIIIERAGFAASIEQFDYAENALKYLAEADRDPVDIIFLDINMPRMDGFEFLDVYSTLPADRQASRYLFMVSTSLNPTDRERALAYEGVTDFVLKPLTRELLERIQADFDID